MKKTFLTKILITYTLVVVGILFSIFVGSYVYLNRDMQKRIDNSNSANFLTYVNNCEGLFNTINYVEVDIKAMKSLDMFAYSSNTDYYAKLTDLYDDVRSFSQGIPERNCTVIIHKMGDNIAVSNFWSTSVTTVLKELGINPDTYAQIISNLPDNSLDGGHYIFTDHNVIHITSKSYVNTKMIIMVVLDSSKFIMSNPDKNMTVSFQSIATNVTDLRSNKLIIPNELNEREIKNSVAFYTKKSNNLTYKFKSSRLLNLNYFYYTNNTIFNRNMILTLLILLLILLVVCTLTFIIIYFFSVKLYKPIKMLVNSFIPFDTKKSDGNATTDEIDYISQQVYNIRNSNQELIKKVEDNNRCIKNKLMYQMLTESYHANSIEYELKLLSIDWLKNDCFVVAFELSNRNNEPVADNSVVLDKITKEIYTQISHSFLCERVFGEIPSCFIISCSNMSTLKETLNDVVTIIGTAFSLIVAAYVGMMSDSVSGLNKSFITSCRLIENKNLMPIKTIYDYRDIRELPVSLVVYPVNNELQLITAVDKNNSQEVRRLLDYIFIEYVDKAFENNEHKDLIIFALANTITRSMQKAGIENSCILEDGDNLYLELKMCENSCKLKQYTLDIFDKILGEIKYKSDIKLDNMKIDFSSYIEENIKNNISLQDISEHFNLSPNYMSYLFKTVVGSNYKDYLSKKQFELAAKLLSEDSSIKLVDLGKQVGICNVNTLIRLFNKYTGAPPGQFVKNKTL